LPSRTTLFFPQICRQCATGALNFFGLIRQAFAEWRRDNASLLAAAIAYYGLFSLSPILIILVAILGLIIGQSAVEKAILAEVGSLIGPGGVTVVKDVIAQAINPAHSFRATALSVIVLLIGATGLFLQTKRALNMVWSVSSPKEMGFFSAAKSYLVSFVLVITLGIMLFITALITAVLIPASSYLDAAISMQLWPLQAASFLISFAFVTALFAVVYKVLSGVDLSWREVLLGSALAAALFSAGNVVIELYVGISGIGSIYGAAASLVVFLIWVYYCAQIFFFGAEFIKVYKRKRDS
jgi:membrane protein